MQEKNSSKKTRTWVAVLVAVTVALIIGVLAVWLTMPTRFDKLQPKPYIHAGSFEDGLEKACAARARVVVFYFYRSSYYGHAKRVRELEQINRRFDGEKIAVVDVNLDHLSPGVNKLSADYLGGANDHALVDIFQLGWDSQYQGLHRLQGPWHVYASLDRGLGETMETQVKMWLKDRLEKPMPFNALMLDCPSLLGLSYAK